MNYSFYVSLPVIDKMVDLGNPAHVRLIEFYTKLNCSHRSITKNQATKMRRLMKSAGLVDSYNDTGRCSIHDIDLSFRKCKYGSMDENEADLPNNCSWVSVTEILK